MPKDSAGVATAAGGGDSGAAENMDESEGDGDLGALGNIAEGKTDGTE
jgi:hypothetical protein